MGTHEGLVRSIRIQTRPGRVSPEVAKRTQEHVEEAERPAPDVAPLEEAPTPQPELRERHEADPDVGDLSVRDWLAVVVRAGKRMPRDNMPMLAQAIAYSTFLAIPSVLLVAVGLFTLLGGAAAIDTVV